jgi:hypothetical protein
VEIALEPDNTPWTGTDIGQAVVASGARLQASGFTPDIIAPSTTSMANAISFFDQLIQVTGVSQYLSDISYHRYAGVSDQNLQAIATRASQYQLRTAMLEHIGSDYFDLHKDLRLGMNSAWQQFALAYCGPDNGGKYYWIENSDPNQPVVNLESRAKFLRQYFKFIRRGAVRIGASSDNATAEPLAFINANGKYVVVVKESAADTLTVQNLPAGTYGIKYTTNAQYNVDWPNVTLAAGQALNTSIPAAGVITIYAITTTVVPPPTEFIYLPLVQRGTN